MVWNPTEYGNLTEIRLPSAELWIPDILLFTSADENFDARFAVNCVVQYTGEVLYAPPSIIKSSCKIDITWFPFDEQLCFLKYGSWSYSARELNLFIDDSGLTEDTNKMDLAYYVPNGGGLNLKRIYPCMIQIPMNGFRSVRAPGSRVPDYEIPGPDRTGKRSGISRISGSDF